MTRAPVVDGVPVPAAPREDWVAVDGEGNEMNVAGSEVVVQPSPYDFVDTLARLVGEILAHGAKVFAVIDHAAGAEDVGLHMPPTTVVIFGDPAVGTRLMVDTPDVALDLPSRVLVRQVGDCVEVAYTSPAALAARHGLAVDKVAGLSGLVTILDDALRR